MNRYWVTYVKNGKKKNTVVRAADKDSVKVVVQTKKPRIPKNAIIGVQDFSYADLLSNKWILAFAVASFIVGAKFLYPGGFGGAVEDVAIEATLSEREENLHKKIEKFAAPLYAAELCEEKHGNDGSLHDAIEMYKERNKPSMRAVLSDTREGSGLSDSEESLIDRKAERRAKRIIEPNTLEECRQLPHRINQGDFDIEHSN